MCHLSCGNYVVCFTRGRPHKAPPWGGDTLPPSQTSHPPPDNWQLSPLDVNHFGLIVGGSGETTENALFVAFGTDRVSNCPSTLYWRCQNTNLNNEQFAFFESIIAYLHNPCILWMSDTCYLYVSAIYINHDQKPREKTYQTIYVYKYHSLKSE